VILDVGIQTAMNGNRSTILSLAPQATNRANTNYRVFYFVGGAFGPSPVGSPGIILAGQSSARWDWFIPAPLSLEVTDVEMGTTASGVGIL
jgi:hypothetical protein